ncbi:hypothetical protein D9M71_103390 [compost metagenome]
MQYRFYLGAHLASLKVCDWSIEGVNVRFVRIVSRGKLTQLTVKAITRFTTKKL